MPQRSVCAKASARRGRPPKPAARSPLEESVDLMSARLAENGILVLELKGVRSQYVVSEPTTHELATRKFRRSARVVRIPGGGAALLDEFVFSMHQLGYVVIQ